jgi:hypothetical protein
MLVGGFTSEAHAAPALQGSIAASGAGLFTACSITCDDFIALGCPKALALPDGVARSIADVSGLAGSKLTFSWTAASTPAYAALGDATGSAAGSKLYFYVLTSCSAPTAGPAFALTTAPNEQATTVTLPSGAAWLIVETDDAQGVTWTGVTAP